MYVLNKCKLWASNSLRKIAKNNSRHCKYSGNTEMLMCVLKRCLI